MEMQPERIGRYKLLRSLGKGGMGEVFLAFDEICGREVALKRIRDDLKDTPVIKNRFLREARIAAQLSHPNIIAIHSIEQENGLSFYTMPFIEGETLRSILKKDSPSLTSLLRIFLNVCQAIAYCHSKNILHRDLKPENILVGKFGETMIVDWGLAQYANVDDEEGDDEDEESSGEFTRPGKVVGTLSYMAPERAQHQPATFSTDLYSLGAILYQILTLRMPFRRQNLKVFRANMAHEQLIDPLEAAPYRDIPPQLAEAARLCLAPKQEERLPSVAALIAEIERYNKGLPEWMPAEVLHVHEKQDWEFQEYVAWSQPFALARTEGALEWVWMMVSKASLLGNFKIEISIRQEQKSRGFHFLFAIPEKKRLSRLEEGWELRIGSPEHPGCSLSRSRIEALFLPEVFLEPGKSHRIVVEKVGQKLDCTLDGKNLFHYHSPLPIIGSHVGLIAHDDLFSIEEIALFSGSHNATINCLAVPDAFLERAEYANALAEYRKISFSFKGRSEGREALFRAGLTLLEKAIDEKSSRGKKKRLQEAFEEFDQLGKTPAAPLEYLGKSLVYRASHDTEEEVKCLELALRKYKDHPMLPLLQEQTLYRMHEACHKNRRDAYTFALLAIRQVPLATKAPEHRLLLHRLREDLEKIPFFHSVDDSDDDLAIQLAFWIAQKRVLEEIAEQTLEPKIESNLWFALLELGLALPQAREPWQVIAKEKDLNRAISLYNESGLEDERLEGYLLGRSLDQALNGKKNPSLTSLASTPWLERLLVCLFLANQEWEKAETVFAQYPAAEINKESHPLFVPFGCYLAHEKGIEAALQHFSDLSTTLSPSTDSLLGHYLVGKPPEKIAPFLWQSKELLRQLALFYSCAGDHARGNTFAKQISRSRVHIPHYS